MRTKILLRLRPLIRLGQSLDPRKWMRLFLSICLTLLGGYISVAVFTLLAKKGLDAKPPKNDTVLVRLIGVMPVATGQPVKETTTRTVPVVNPKDTVKPPPPRDTTTKFKAIYRPTPDVHPVTPEQQGFAQQASRLNNPLFPLWAIVLVVLAISAGIFYVAYFNLPYISPEMRRDLDPQPLTKMFEAYATQIESLGNPRKIKRLSNKMRFQYHYLTLKGIKDEASLGALAKGLILLERMPAEAAPPKNKPEAAAPKDDTEKEYDRDEPEKEDNPEEAYRQFVQDNGLASPDDRFGQLFFMLNKESF
jgi:hypothetical protein